MAKVGENDYRIGARERLLEASVLLRLEHFGGSIYLGGRAVEGMLRAVVWKSDRSFAIGQRPLETGHDLRELLRLIARLGALRENPLRDHIHSDVQHVARLWWNDMRFLPEAKIKNRWFELGELRGKRTLKDVARGYYDSCSSVIRRCEAIWHK